MSSIILLLCAGCQLAVVSFAGHDAALDFDKISGADPDLETEQDLFNYLQLEGGHSNRPDFELGQIIDPFEDRENMSGNGTGSSSCNVTGMIDYDNGVMVRIVYIPSFAVLLFSTLFLVYAILTLLKPLLKIYLSVLFYAVCQLFLVLCLVLSLVSTNLYDDSHTSCSITEPLQNVGMILPGYAVLAITLIRYIFLKFPMNWRNVLRMPYQIIGFLIMVIFAIILANLPNFGLCGFTLYTKGDMVQCRYSNTGSLCTVFYVLYVLFGFVLPPVTVLILYTLIYSIISKHRAYVAARTTSGTRSRTATTKSTRASGAFNSSGASEGLLNSESLPKSDGERSEKERSTVPWSIIVIMVLNLLSTLPWIPQSLYPDLFYGCQPGEIVLLVDILWTVLILSVSLSPIAYLLTTQSVREQLRRWLVCPCLKDDTDKQFQRLSNV